MVYLAVITSLVTSIFLTFVLKGLEYFRFIDWNPVGYTNKLNILEGSHPFLQWLFLVIMIFVVTLLLYFTMQFVEFVPPFVTSLVIGACIALIAEWIIFDLPAELKSFKKISIPFMVTIIIFARFVFETAVFHYKASNTRNKLPYKDTMIQ